MALTRAAANNRPAKTATATVTAVTLSKATARAEKKAKHAERARLVVMKQTCLAAQKKRDEAAASAYIGTMKYLGATHTTPNTNKTLYTLNTVPV